MTRAGASDADPRPAPEAPGPAWRAWPLRRHPARGVLGAVVVGGTVWGTWDWTRDGWLAALAAAVLFVATAPFFVPTRYRLSAEGVEIGRPWGTTRRPWSRFRAVRRGGELLVLSTSVRPSWLDSIRGETLVLESAPEGVPEYVEAMVGTEARAGAR